MVFKCPECHESLSSDLASNVRKHVATHPKLTGEALLGMLIWDLKPIEWSGSNQYGGEQVQLPITTLVGELDPHSPQGQRLL